jgi:thioester reductase-like protein
VSYAKALAVRVARFGGTRLVVAVAGAVDSAAVRAHLAGKLPRASLPQHILVLPALPLTDNGKVDLRALHTAVEEGLRVSPERAAVGGDDEDASAAERIARIMGEALETAEFGLDEDFLARGGDSLRAMAVVLRLRAAFGASLGVQHLYQSRTPSALAAVLEAATEPGPDAQETDEALMERDARLAADLTAPAHAQRALAPPRTVLVTGATGFVGSRAVLHLLRDTDISVVCIVRGESDERAGDRLVRVLRGLDPAVGTGRDRLRVHAGDLGRPRCGLTPRDWDALAAECDAVLHIGALVNLLFDYRAHRSANVLGTLEILRLCLTGRIKALHHVSTLGALDRHAAALAAAGGGPVGEYCDPAAATPPLGGYSRSKWVAERLVLDAGGRGAPVTVYRLGEVMPAGDGRPNPRALTHLLLCAFRRVGAAPAVPMRTDYTPVDQVADRLVAGLGDPAVRGLALHVFHGDGVNLPDLAPGLPAVSEAGFRRALAERGREFEVLLALPAGLERVLTDNPALFTRDACADLDRRHGLGDGPLGPSIAAYQQYLDTTR